jgi:rifampicin phosphotransferase
MMTGKYVLDLAEVDATMAGLTGGKGASLGELMRVGGIRVPAGFCVTTDAFRRIAAAGPVIGRQLGRLAHVSPEDRETVSAVSAEIRRAVEGVTVPGDLAAEITGAVAALGEQARCAVRSSATAEDLPTASFAGQQDTYLNVTGAAEIIRHVSRCWASLFSERAVLYRQRNGFDHRKVEMAVVVQQMVAAEASGVLFTADPVTSNRKIVSVEAVTGLGEALVSGLVNADSYQVRDGEITSRKPRGQPVLTDRQIVRLAELGRRIEAHFGRPQDIEWCLAGDEFQVVQSRPVTTLFPVPEVSDDGNHVYVSVGHQQMMTDAMKPLGISVWQLTAARPMATAGGRLFVDVTRQLGTPATRAGLVRALGTSDPLIGDALQTVIDRGDFVPELPEGDAGAALPRSVAPGAQAPVETDPAVVTEITGRARASLDILSRDIRGRQGADLLDFIAADVQELKKVMFTPRNLQVITAGMEASAWLNGHLREWLGETNAADTLTQSAPGNVTAEMGLALLDVADAIRPYPGVVAFLEHAAGARFLDQLPALDGGRAARDAIGAFLDRYGMRGVGEIDITRPRWRERPDLLIPVLLGNVRNFGPGAGKARFERGRQEATEKERELLDRLRLLPDGERKAAETKRMIDRVRTFAGYREYPKYHMVSRYFVYKQALLAEADRLVAAGVLGTREDIFYLTFGELGVVVRTGKSDENLIRERESAFRVQAALTPPRVLTSDGEALSGSYRRGDVPAGALAGLPVSAGTVEGRARVVLDLAGAALEADDILVTAYTDPSWTPVFVAVKGLVTEVGGLMTHGAVIAREYGLPAVVGVEHATRLIRDGQRIRVHGTEGYVELLSEQELPRPAAHHAGRFAVLPRSPRARLRSVLSAG